MSGSTTTYARRTVEAAVLSHIASVLNPVGPPEHDQTSEPGALAYPPSSAVRVVVLLGDPGNGARSMLLHGIVPALREPAAPVDGAWHPDAVIQYAVTADAVPMTSPARGSAVRLLVVACSDFGALPNWIADDRSFRPQVFTVGTLSLTELDEYLATVLGAPADLLAARRLGAASGFVPGVLIWLVRELTDIGRLELVDGVWHLIGDAVDDTVLRHVRARLSALAPPRVDVMQRIALAEPVRYDTLAPGDRDTVDALRREGVMQRDGRGEVTFRAPCVAEALRELSPVGLAHEVNERLLASGRVTEPVMRWALRTGHEVPATVVEGAVTDALDRQDWSRALTLAELAVERSAPTATGADESERLRWLCELHLSGATAARHLSDSDRAHTHVDEAEQLASTGHASPHLQRSVAIVRAEVLHFLDGDPDAALHVLVEPPGATDRIRAETLSQRIIHLVVAARVRQARALAITGKPRLRRAPHGLRMRVKACLVMLDVMRGKPRRALRRSLVLLAENGVTIRVEPRVTAEVQSAYVIAALSSDGPASFPALAKHFNDTRDESYHPDLVAFAFARATWAYALGRISEAHRLAMVALGTVERSDPAGLASAVLALLAETSALLGDTRQSADFRARFEHVAARASGFLLGGSHAHLAAADLALTYPDAVGRLLTVAQMHLEHDRAGFAAEVLYAGVRFGQKRAATELLGLAGELDGNLHRLRVAHATAVLADDPVALLSVAAQFERVGSVLYATEAAALVAQDSAAPETARRRARAIIANQNPALAGHPLLGKSIADATQPWSVEPLTRREREVLDLIDAGLSNSDIAQRLGLSHRTVEGHITRLYRKTGDTRRAPDGRRARPQDRSA